VPGMATAQRTTWNRYSPLAGVAAVILWIIGVFIAESGDASRDDETALSTLRWFVTDESEITAGEITFAFGVLLFIWFLGAVRTALLAREPSGHLTAIFYGAGILAAGAMLIQAAVLIQPSFMDEGTLTPQAAQTLAIISDAMFGVIELTLAVALSAAGLVILATRVLPAWLGWATVALALLLLIVPIGWIGVIFGVPLWILVVAVLLFMRPVGEPVAARPPPPHEPL
jgi:hypothetical protein